MTQPFLLYVTNELVSDRHATRFSTAERPSHVGRHIGPPGSSRSERARSSIRALRIVENKTALVHGLAALQAGDRLLTRASARIGCSRTWVRWTLIRSSTRGRS